MVIGADLLATGLVDRTKGKSDILLSEDVFVVITKSWFSHLEACITRTSGSKEMLST